MAIPRFDGGTSLTTSPPILSVPLVISSSPAIRRKQGRLAAARRPDEHDKLALLDIEIDPLDDVDCAERLLEIGIVQLRPWSLNPDQPLTEPASRPRTRKRCSEKNTATGTMIETKAEAVRISQLPPRDPSSSLRRPVSTS